METKKVAVLLMASSMRPTSGLQPPSFYDTYIFDLQTGIAGFWFAQTGGNVKIEGDVKPWLPFQTDPDFDDRDAIDDAARQRTIDRYRNDDNPKPLAGYDFVISFIAAPLDAMGQPRGINAGSADGGNVVASAGDPFDFIAHEVGHQLGFAHSFNQLVKKYDKDHREGEYGHGYCIMSALIFGEQRSNRAVPAFAGATPEYAGYGPGLSAATRVAKGWLPATPFTVTATPEEATIASIGRGGHPSPRALEIRGRNGVRYVICYRARDDQFDFAASQPALVIDIVESSWAESANPGLSAATLEKVIQLPLALDGPSMYHGPDFALAITAWDPWGGTVKVRIAETLSDDQVELGSQQSTHSRDIVSKGKQSFAAGEFLCVEGVYDFIVWHQPQSIAFEVTTPIAMLGPVRWQIEGQWLLVDTGSLVLTKYRRQYPPIPFGNASSGPVTVRYEVQSLSRLLIFNDPADGNYEINVTAHVTTSVGSGTFRGWGYFTGQGATMLGEEYERDRDICLIKRADWARTHERRKILLPGDIWQSRVTPENIDRVRNLLEIASAAAADDAKTYQQALSALEHELGVAALEAYVEQPTARAQPLLPPTACGHPRKLRPSG